MFSNHHSFGFVSCSEREPGSSEADLRGFIDLVRRIAVKSFNMLVLRPPCLSFRGAKIDVSRVWREHSDSSARGKARAADGEDDFSHNGLQ